MDVMRMFLMRNGNFDENGRKSFEEVETQDGAVTLAAAREVRLLYIVLVVCFLFIIFVFCTLCLLCVSYLSSFVFCILCCCEFHNHHLCFFVYFFVLCFCV